MSHLLNFLLKILIQFKKFLFIFPFLIGWFPLSCLPRLQDHWFVLTHSQIYFSSVFFISFIVLFCSVVPFYIFWFFVEVLTVFIYSSPEFGEHLYNLLFKQFYWNILIVDLQCCTNSAVWQSDSVIFVYILFHILFHYGLLHIINHICVINTVYLLQRTVINTVHILFHYGLLHILICVINSLFITNNCNKYSSLCCRVGPCFHPVYNSLHLLILNS